MKISEVAVLLLGENCSILAVDIVSIILFIIYSLMLSFPLYVVFSILKYKRKK